MLPCPFTLPIITTDVHVTIPQQAIFEAKHSYDVVAIIIDATGINSLDSTAVHTLHDIIDTLKNKNIKFLWANVKGSVRDTMKTSGLTDKIGVDNFFLTTHDAVEYIGAYMEDHDLKPVRRAQDKTSDDDTQEVQEHRRVKKRMIRRQRNTRKKKANKSSYNGGEEGTAKQGNIQIHGARQHGAINSTEGDGEDGGGNVNNNPPDTSSNTPADDKSKKRFWFAWRGTNT